MQWSPVSKAELPAYLKKAAALLAVATVLGGCSGQPSNSEPTQTALAGEVYPDHNNDHFNYNYNRTAAIGWGN